ncbi:hypothetical protein [Amycolatopsis nalaikhensis]|uniref:Uncharacterized protein n=1 Tax=Amycolatopsis nalaikhensis TaxID=715472 RepID=A0ABY8XQD4_9PSEU|nr:hypothetical protein [Amycolatopsis sp. 2-2]WIV57870.1 hypothetical protein QP939_04085 [Amycolatopsis sp. 2-2]
MPADMPVLPGTSRLGMLILADSECPLMWQPGVVRHARLGNDRWVLHLPAESPLVLAQDVRRTHGVLGVSVQPSGPITAADRLALVFAEHLSVVRTLDKSPYPLSGAFVTSAKRDVPGARDALIRLFHFASVQSPAGLSDVIVWEWIDRPNAEAWFGAPLPDLGPLELHLAELLQLRRAARANQYPKTPDGAALADALKDRPFSSRFVLDNYYLVCRLIAGHLDKESDQ